MNATALLVRRTGSKRPAGTTRRTKSTPRARTAQLVQRCALPASSCAPPTAVAVCLVACLVSAAPAHAQYTEDVTLRFQANQITYQGPIASAWLMLDVEGGRNKVANARQMSCDNGNPKVCTLTTALAEGNYIYVFVANPDAFVDMSDLALNPDDIPDSNFFRDPSPRDSGFCGQFSTDNCLFVRDPDRPVFLSQTFAPGHGALVTSPTAQISVQLGRGADAAALDGSTLRVRYEDHEPQGVRFTGGAPIAPALVDVPGASFAGSAAGGTVTATLAGVPEGFHRVLIDIDSESGLPADTFTGSVLVNRDNQAPVARAGATVFTSVNREVILDGSLSNDPDQIGFAEYQWRVISGPGEGFFRCVDEEHVPRDGFGKPQLDEHGNPRGDACRRSDAGAMPRFRANAAGTYVVGLRVRDIGASGGTLSVESSTEVVVVGAFNTGVRPRVEVAIDGNTVRVDGSLSSGGTARFFADRDNPSPLTLSVSGSAASFSKPAIEGAYLVHMQVDESYPATAMIRVLPGGAVDGFDFARPPADWQRGEKVMYLTFVRELFDEDGDGEGDLLGMIDKLDYLAQLGVTTLWLMPLSEGPTTHGYATTGAFSVDADYGSVDDLELLTETAKSFGLEIVMDFVANHTSDQHPFFQAGQQNPNSPLREFYAFNDDGSYRYAFTFFALPDQDQNNPIVRRSLIDTVHWFMDRGIEGVRCDIAGFTPPSFWKLLRKEVKARDPNAILLAELIPPMAEYFDHGFDLAYDSTSFWATRDAFAVGGSFDNVDGSLEDATRFIERAQSERARNITRQEDVLFMRYIDNQDEDRFLLRAGGDVRKARAVAGFLLTTPGVPLITYGNEVGIQELRGRYPFADYDDDADRFGDSSRDQLMKLYRKLIAIRKGNRALRAADSARDLQTGNTYLRIASGGDDGGNNVYSFARFADGQRFIVLINRADSTAIGTSVRVFPPPALFADFPEQTLTLVDHLDPSVRVTLSRAQLTAPVGVSLTVPAFGTRIFQVTKGGISDADGDKVLDSYDVCVGIANADQSDLDGDRVGDRCDQCVGSARGSETDRNGCAADSGEPHSRWLLDGALDDIGLQVAAASGITLHASFNGAQLYVATEASSRGEDVFIVVTDDTGRTAVAPFAKAGTVPTGGVLLADEGDNDFSRWFGVTGEAVAYTEALPGRGVLEGTLNLAEEFAEVPAVIYIAALRYAGTDGGSLLAQAPAGNGDDVVDASEMFALATALPPLVDVGGGEGEGEGEGEQDIIGTPGDVDGDGTENLVDNCPQTHNPAQTDADGDGLGDGCDRCPLTSPGVLVDDAGCGAREVPITGAAGRANPHLLDPAARSALERECGCTTTGQTDGVPAALLGLVLLHLLRARGPRLL